jgi:uncharacterized protein YukE
MTILHMDTDACKSMQSNMLAVNEQLQEQLNALYAAVENLAGTGKSWQAGGADQYRISFQQWHATVISRVSELNPLSSRLLAEINAWEEVGSTF